MRKITKRSAAIIAASVIAVGGGAAAWAAVTGWNIGGTGTANGDAATITPMSATVSVTDKVFPGYTGTVSTSVSNSNTFPVKLATTAAGLTGVVVTGGPTPGTCQTALSAPDPSMLVATYPSWAPNVAAGAVNQAIDANFSVGSLPQSCAGSHIVVTYTFSGTSAA